MPVAFLATTGTSTPTKRNNGMHYRYHQYHQPPCHVLLLNTTGPSALRLPPWACRPSPSSSLGTCCECADRCSPTARRPLGCASSTKRSTPRSDGQDKGKKTIPVSNVAMVSGVIGVWCDWCPYAQVMVAMSLPFPSIDIFIFRLVLFFQFACHENLFPLEKAV